MAYEQQNLLLTILEAGKPKIRHQHIQYLVRAHFLIQDGYLLIVSSHGRVVRELSGVSFGGGYDNVIVIF